MQNFKVGDWVRDLRDNRVFQINSTNFNLKLSTKNSVYEHWQPAKGEWCWYEHMLVKLISIRQNTKGITIYSVSTPMSRESYVGAIKLEPFIGTLPSFLKDNT